MRQVWFVSCLIVMVFFPNFIFSQDASEDLFNLSLEELLNVEIKSASKSAQKASEAPSIVSVITKNQINQYGWVSINDILYKLPGFIPSQDYDRRNVSARGMFEGWNNNHFLLLMDGVPYNDNLYGTAYTWENTPLFFVKSMEIIRGPGSALYGSNATNGVLTLNTVSAEDLDGKNVFKYTIGTNNTETYDVLTGKETEDFSIAAGFNYFHTDGNEYKSYDASSFDYYYDGFPLDSMYAEKKEVKDNRKSSYFFSKIEGKNKFDGLSLQLHHHTWEFQTGHGWLWQIPDFDESMKESRSIITLSYKPEAEDKFSQEYTLRYQRHNIDWNMRYYVNGSWPYEGENGDLVSFYPAGMWEYLNTYSQDIFTRLQFGYTFDKDMNILAGLENTIFLYSGDNEHYSNVDLNISYAPWYPDNRMVPLGPWFEWVKNKPVINIGVFSQFTSGDLLGEKLKMTLGLRYDNQFFDYKKIYDEGKPEDSKSFSQVSPRLGLVYLASEDLSFKLLAGRAFRAPSPTELFGSNTWTLASNLEELEPEIITTFELGSDWKITKNYNFRLNGYHTKFENQIAYSLANNNLSTNIYTLTTAGFESELLFGFDNVSGFLNYSFAKRLDEEIIDSTITESSDELTWVPAHTANFGITYTFNKLAASLSGHYQGEVLRRESDAMNSDLLFLYDDLRPEKVKSWFSVDIGISYAVHKYAELGLTVKNVFDSENYLVKNFAFPFDYQMPGREVQFIAKINF